MLKKIKYILTSSEKRRLMFLAAGIIILSLSEVFSVGILIPILGLFVDDSKIYSSKIIQWVYQFTGASDKRTFLTILVVSAIAIFILKSIYSVFILYLQQNITGSIRRRIKSAALLSYLKKPYLFHIENNSAVLFKDVITEVADFSVGFIGSIIMIMSEGFIIAGIFLLLLFNYPAVTLMVFAALGIIFAFFNYFSKERIKKYSMDREKYSGQKYKYAFEALSAIKEIQVYNAYSFFLERFSSSVKKYINGLIRYNILANMPRYILEALLFSLVLIGLLVSVHSGKTAVELIPMFGVLVFATLKMLPSVNKIYMHFNNVIYHQNSLDIVYNIIKGNEPETEETLNLNVSDSSGMDANSIMLKDITFFYNSAHRPVLEDLNLTIPRYKTVAFVGESGAGKTTLVNIIMGLLAPSKGILSYKGKLIDKNKISEYRQIIGYVPQQVFLTDDTIESNIAFGITVNEIDNSRIAELLKITQLDSFIRNLPQGVKTLIGEGGVKLSGGQKQRIAIARALYRNPEILILDEATSSLDGYTESEVTRAIKNLSGNLTIVIVAHRLSTIEHADIIYVVENGRIADSGKFNELLGKSLSFQRIANKLSSLEN